MDNVERARATHGVRVAVPPGDDGHALLWLAYCPNCQETVNADRGFLADCWHCAKPLPRRFNSRREVHVAWMLLDEARPGGHEGEEPGEWYCCYCGVANPMADTKCGKCKGSQDSTGV